MLVRKLGYTKNALHDVRIWLKMAMKTMVGKRLPANTTQTSGILTLYWSWSRTNPDCCSLTSVGIIGPEFDDGDGHGHNKNKHQDNTKNYGH